MKERSFIIGLAAGIVVCLAAGWIAWKSQTPKPEPNLAPLESQMQAVAEKALPLPSLGGRTVVLAANQTDPQERVAKIIALTQRLGGSALRGLDRDDGGVVVLATIPESAVENFAILAAQWPIPEGQTAAASGGEMENVEVVLKK